MISLSTFQSSQIVKYEFKSSGRIIIEMSVRNKQRGKMLGISRSPQPFLTISFSLWGKAQVHEEEAAKLANSSRAPHTTRLIMKTIRMTLAAAAELKTRMTLHKSSLSIKVQ